MFYEVTADVMARLPEKLQNLVEFGAIGGAVNPEIDKLNAAIGLMAANAFIDTVDSDGLKRWEKILGVTSPLTVYKQRIINDPYHFEVANEKDYVKEASISGNAIQNGTPTPEAPIMPVCLASGTEIKVVGKNHFNKASMPNYKSANVATSEIDSGIVVTNSAGVYQRAIYKVEVTPNSVYTISYLATELAGSQTNKCSVSIVDGVYPIPSGALPTALLNVNGAGEKIRTFTPTASYVWAIFFSSYSVDSETSNKFDNVQIEKGSVATPYEPYTLHQTLTVPCDLWKVGTAADPLNWLTGVATQRIYKRVLNGIEDWILQGTNSNNIISFTLRLSTTEISPTTVAVPAISSHFVYTESAFSAATTQHIFIQRTSSNTTAYVRMYASTMPDLQSFKSWLAAQYAAGTPVTVWYELATPIETQHTPQSITLPVGTVNMVVESSNGVLPSAIDITLAEYQADETFQARKNAIKSKLMTKPPINLETLRTIIEAYMGVEVEITIADSVVSVVYRGDTEVVDLAPLYATLYETIPANLLVQIAYKYLQWLELDAQLLDFDTLDALGMDWDEFERGDWIG